MRVRWTRSSRKHRIGRAHALYVMNTTAPDPVVTNAGDDALLWVGTDTTGRGLEVVAIMAAGPELIVIHVMPVDFRKDQL